MFILLFLGLAASVCIIRIHHQIAIHLGEKSFWNISDLFDCEMVLASRYARLGPFLIAELAIGYYLILITGLLDVWSSQKNLSILTFLLVLTTFSTVFSIILNFLSLVNLGVLCLLCLLTSLINLALLVLLFLAMEIPLRKLPRTIKRKFLFNPKPALIYGSIALIIMGLGVTGGRKLNPHARFSFDILQEDYLKGFFALPKQNVLLPKRPVLGNPNAQVSIVVFSDFQCPACRSADITLKAILEQYKDRVRIFYLNYPLNSSCNQMVSRPKHPSACIYAKEAICAYQSGKVSEYHDWALKNHSEQDTSPSELSNKLGMDRGYFEDCLASDKTTELLKQDIETAIQFGVKSIPSIYINGRQIRDWRNQERFRWVLESTLVKFH